MKTLIQNISIIDSSDTSLTYNIKKVSITIADDCIVSVGVVPFSFVPDHIIEGEGRLALPGFVNTHTHLFSSSYAPFIQCNNFFDWLHQVAFYEHFLTPSDCYWASLYSIKELLESGVTCVCDMSLGLPETLKACNEAGIRGVLGKGIIENESTESVANIISYVNSLTRDCSSRLRVGIAPHSLWSCSPEFLVKLFSKARDHDLLIQMHYAETREEALITHNRYGMSGLELLDLTNVLEKTNTLLSHAIWVNEQDLNIIQKYNFSVASCPASNSYLGVGIFPLKRYLKQKINVTIGTDGMASNPLLTYLSDLRTYKHIQNAINEDARSITYQDLLKMSTSNAAMILRTGNVGRIESGQKADLTLFRLPLFHSNVSFDSLISSTLFSNRSVETVLIDGVVVYENGAPTLYDYEQVEWEMHKIWSRLSKL